MSNRLTGVRLGARQRDLLLRAPGPEAIEPLDIHPSGQGKSAANAALLAAAGLERAGLVVGQTRSVWTRALDERLARPYYRDGAFWLRADPRRQHLARRRAIRRTRFGQGIAIEFRRELGEGRKLRWSDARVERAARTGEEISVESLIWQVGMLDRQARAPERPSLDPELEPVEFIPDGTRSAADLGRWRDCCRGARRAIPKGGDRTVLDEALRRFSSPRP